MQSAAGLNQDNIDAKTLETHDGNTIDSASQFTCMQTIDTPERPGGIFSPSTTKHQIHKQHSAHSLSNPFLYMNTGAHEFIPKTLN